MKLRFALLLPLLLSAFALFAQLSPQPAAQVLKEAYEQAAKENKNIFIIFHASWCGWCHKMDSSMNDVSCRKSFDDNYVIRHLVVQESRDKKNLEKPGEDEYLPKHNGDNQGILYC